MVWLPKVNGHKNWKAKSFGFMIRILHASSFVFAVAALALLVTFAAIFGTASYVVGMSTFGAILVLFYGWNVIGHYKNVSWFSEVLLYLLIAATYTTVALILPQRGWGWSIFGVAWGLTVLIIGLKLFTKLSGKWLKVFLYGSFFVLDAAAFSVVHAFLSPVTFVCLSIGGLSYILATFLSAFSVKWAPIFVVLGSVGHFWGMLEQILYRTL